MLCASRGELRFGEGEGAVLRRFRFGMELDRLMAESREGVGSKHQGLPILCFTGNLGYRDTFARVWLKLEIFDDDSSASAI